MRCDERDVFELPDLAAHLRDAELRAEKQPIERFAEGDDDFRAHDFDFLAKLRKASVRRFGARLLRDFEETFDERRRVYVLRRKPCIALGAGMHPLPEQRVIAGAEKRTCRDIGGACAQTDKHNPRADIARTQVYARPPILNAACVARFEIGVENIEFLASVAFAQSLRGSFGLDCRKRSEHAFGRRRRCPIFCRAGDRLRRLRAV